MPAKNNNAVQRHATAAEKENIEITLAWLEARCTKDEDTGCWVWKGCMTKTGLPQARLLVAPKVAATMLVRRLVLKMVKHGEKMPYGMSVERWLKRVQVGIQPDCLYGCCSPDHVVGRTKKQAMALRKGVPLTLQHRLHISMGRRRNSRVSDEAIHEMLTSDEKARDLSIKHGMDPSYASKVRRGNIRCLSANDGMFTALLRRAA